MLIIENKNNNQNYQIIHNSHKNDYLLQHMSSLSHLPQHKYSIIKIL